MDNNIRSYTLDCGCYFEHKKNPGCIAYELVLACDEHKKLGRLQELSLSPPLPPPPFLSVPQAGDVTHCVIEALEHTQPLPPLNRRQSSLDAIETVMDLQDRVAALETRVSVLDRPVR